MCGMPAQSIAIVMTFWSFAFWLWLERTPDTAPPAPFPWPKNAVDQVRNRPDFSNRPLIFASERSVNQSSGAMLNGPRLPLASGSVQDVRRAAYAAIKSGPVRVLVADDNRDAADSLQRVLVLYGHDVRVAYDGVSAMQIGREFRPRVAVLDIGMPGTDGYTVAREIRKQHGREVTIVALTGWGQEDDRRRAIEAGFDHHLVKPVDPDALNVLLAQTGAERR